MAQERQRILTGVKPTGQIHLGNYVGAIKPAIELSESGHECFYFLADYHSLTTIHSAKELSDLTYEASASWLALGLDPHKSTFFRQSDIPEIFELNWILSCFTAKGLMNRAHAYKALTDQNREKGADADEGVNMGLYNYPVLMSADILTFQSDAVPVGEDQLQHLEIARDIATCFNHRMKKDLFKLPRPLISKTVGVLPGLDGRKMSKSYNNTLPLFMPTNKLRKLIMRIVTDSSGPNDPKDPDTSFIFQLYSSLSSSEQQEAMRKQYLEGISWGAAKEALYLLLEDKLAPYRVRFEELMNDRGELDRILKEGAVKARHVASCFLDEVRQSIGMGLW